MSSKISNAGLEITLEQEEIVNKVIEVLTGVEWYLRVKTYACNVKCEEIKPLRIIRIANDDDHPEITNYCHDPTKNDLSIAGRLVYQRLCLETPTTEATLRFLFTEEMKKFMAVRNEQIETRGGVGYYPGEWKIRLQIYGADERQYTHIWFLDSYDPEELFVRIIKIAEFELGLNKTKSARKT